MEQAPQGANFLHSPTSRVSGFLFATPIGLEVAGSNPAVTHWAAEAIRKKVHMCFKTVSDLATQGHGVNPSLITMRQSISNTCPTIDG